MTIQRNLITSIILAGSLSTVAAHANYEVNIESVSNFGGCPGWGNMPNSITNGDGFRLGMLQAGLFTAGTYYTDSGVWDTDFRDPERSGLGDSDHLYWDRPNKTAIGYFTGHGNSQKCVDNVYCGSSTQCNFPPPGATGQGACRQAPDSLGITQQWCCYDSPRAAQVCSPGDSYGGVVNQSTGNVALGETYYWGNWANAGFNGGMNLAIFDQSHGMVAPFFLQEYGAMFAGVRLIATIMPIAGDTANSPNRGTQFASLYLATSGTGIVTQAWQQTLTALSPLEGTACGPADRSKGGGHGINGCGCNFIMNMEVNQYWALQKTDYGTWDDLVDDSKDPSAASWYEWRAKCNYDSSVYNWRLP